MMVKKKKANAKKPKQGFLPDMEPPSIKAIDDAAENYWEAMMERTELSKQEDEKKTALIEVMRENKLDQYETAEGIVVTLTAKSNVKAKRKKDATEGAEE